MKQLWSEYNSQIITHDDHAISCRITGEHHNGNQLIYEKPQVMKFEISRKEDEYILDVIEDDGASDGTIIKLRLTNR